MPERESPRVLRLLDEVDMLISRLDDRLSHVLLPQFPPNTAKEIDQPESIVFRRLKSIAAQLGQLNDRVEG